MSYTEGVQVTPEMQDMKVNCRILTAPRESVCSPVLSPSPTYNSILNVPSSQGSDVTWMPSQSDDSKTEEARYAFLSYEVMFFCTVCRFDTLLISRFIVFDILFAAAWMILN